MVYGVQLRLKSFQVREARGKTMKSGKDFYEDFKDMAQLDREAFFVITLNQKNKVIDKYLVSLGTLTSALIHPREVFKPAIIDGAAAVAFAHNHPSGDPAPSEHDKAILKTLIDASEILGIRVLDNLIIGEASYISFVDEGLM